MWFYKKIQCIQQKLTVTEYFLYVSVYVEIFLKVTCNSINHKRIQSGYNVQQFKYVTGFTDLTQDDQLLLIKGGFFEIWLTRMAGMFNKFDGMFTFEDGSMIQRDELSVVFTVNFILSHYSIFLCTINNFETSMKEIFIG